MNAPHPPPPALHGFDPDQDALHICPLHGKFLPCRRCGRNPDAPVTANSELVALARAYHDGNDTALVTLRSRALAQGLFTIGDLVEANSTGYLPS